MDLILCLIVVYPYRINHKINSFQVYFLLAPAPGSIQSICHQTRDPQVGSSCSVTCDGTSSAAAACVCLLVMGWYLYMAVLMLCRWLIKMLLPLPMEAIHSQPGIFVIWVSFGLLELSLLGHQDPRFCHVQRLVWAKQSALNQRDARQIWMSWLVINK